MTRKNTIRYTQRMPEDVQQAAIRLADARKMSLNDFIVDLVERQIEIENKSHSLYLSQKEVIEAINELIIKLDKISEKNQK